MNSSLRLSTALVTSLSLAMTHMPLAAFAQDLPEGVECQEGETAEACLARALEEAAAAEAAEGSSAATQAEAEAAAQAEAEAAAQAEAEAAAQADAEAAAAEAAAAEAAAAEAAAAEAAAAEAAAAEAAAQAEAEAAAQAEAEAAAQAEADAAAAEAAAAEAAAAEAAAAEAAAAEAAAAEAAAAEAAAAEAAATEAAAAEAAAQAEAEAAAQAEAEAAAAEDAAAEAAAQAEAEAAAQAEADAAAAEAAAAEAAAAEAAAAEAAAAETEAAEAAAAEAAAAETEAAEAAAAETEAATDEEALAAALAEAAEEAGAEGAAEPDLVTIEELPAEEAAVLEAAAETAAAAEEAAATPVDPVVQAEAEVEEQAVDAEQQLQSLALAPEAAPATEVVTEVITEETARSAEQEFAPIVTTEAAATAAVAQQPRQGGLSPLEAALLAGAAGLVVGSILSGNRQVVNRADDRVVVLRPEGDYQVIRDDDVLLRRPGNGVVTESFPDGSSRSIVTQPDGTQVVTVRDRDLRILRRTVVAPDGTRTVLIDDTAPVQPVIVSQLPPLQAAPAAFAFSGDTDADALRRALEAQGGYDRSFSLAQIRSIRAVRDLAPVIDLENVTFASGSAAIGPDQAQQLLALGRYMSDAIARNPREMFFVEGHTDAVGGAAFNLALSDRRAETVALALTQYFGVAPQNMVIQGYGEEYLRIPTLADERLNRRVAVRRITDLLQVAAAN